MQGGMEGLQEKIGRLLAEVSQIARGQEEIKELIRALEARVQDMEQSAARSLSEVRTQIQFIEGTLNDHESRIRQAEGAIQGLIRTQRVLSWLGGTTLGAALLWFLGRLLEMMAR